MWRAMTDTTSGIANRSWRPPPTSGKKISRDRLGPRRGARTCGPRVTGLLSTSLLAQIPILFYKVAVVLCAARTSLAGGDTDWQEGLHDTGGPGVATLPPGDMKIPPVSRAASSPNGQEHPGYLFSSAGAGAGAAPVLHAHDEDLQNGRPIDPGAGAGSENEMFEDGEQLLDAVREETAAQALADWEHGTSFLEKGPCCDPVEMDDSDGVRRYKPAPYEKPMQRGGTLGANRGRGADSDTPEVKVYKDSKGRAGAVATKMKNVFHSTAGMMGTISDGKRKTIDNRKARNNARQLSYKENVQRKGGGVMGKLGAAKDFVTGKKVYDSDSDNREDDADFRTGNVGSGAHQTANVARMPQQTQVEALPSGKKVKQDSTAETSETEEGSTDDEDESWDDDEEYYDKRSRRGGGDDSFDVSEGYSDDGYSGSGASKSDDGDGYSDDDGYTDDDSGAASNSDSATSETPPSKTSSKTSKRKKASASASATSFLQEHQLQKKRIARKKQKQKKKAAAAKKFYKKSGTLKSGKMQSFLQLHEESEDSGVLGPALLGGQAGQQEPEMLDDPRPTAFISSSRAAAPSSWRSKKRNKLVADPGLEDSTSSALAAGSRTAVQRGPSAGAGGNMKTPKEVIMLLLSGSIETTGRTTSGDESTNTAGTSVLQQGEKIHFPSTSFLPTSSSPTTGKGDDMGASTTAASLEQAGGAATEETRSQDGVEAASSRTTVFLQPVDSRIGENAGNSTTLTIFPSSSLEIVPGSRTSTTPSTFLEEQSASSLDSGSKSQEDWRGAKEASSTLTPTSLGEVTGERRLHETDRKDENVEEQQGSAPNRSLEQAIETENDEQQPDLEPPLVKTGSLTTAAAPSSSSSFLQEQQTARLEGGTGGSRGSMGADDDNLNPLLNYDEATPGQAESTDHVEQRAAVITGEDVLPPSSGTRPKTALRGAGRVRWPQVAAVQGGTTTAAVGTAEGGSSAAAGMTETPVVRKTNLRGGMKNL
ncbi:unnamed protein product [Amoebophrya sp. A120]|nr:unnamed protein product [Amoebophrya sp. A120]|eukprot:GSA120T00023345001.1